MLCWRARQPVRQQLCLPAGAQGGLRAWSTLVISSGDLTRKACKPFAYAPPLASSRTSKALRGLLDSRSHTSSLYISRKDTRTCRGAPNSDRNSAHRCALLDSAGRHTGTRVRTHQKLTAAVVAALDEVEYVVKSAGYHAPEVRLLCALHGVRLAGAGLTIPARKHARPHQSARQVHTQGKAGRSSQPRTQTRSRCSLPVCCQQLAGRWPCTPAVCVASLRCAGVGQVARRQAAACRPSRNLWHTYFKMRASPAASTAGHAVTLLYR
jgi:hypothetical protein